MECPPVGIKHFCGFVIIYAVISLAELLTEFAVLYEPLLNYVVEVRVQIGSASAGSYGDEAEDVLYDFGGEKLQPVQWFASHVAGSGLIASLSLIAVDCSDYVSEMRTNKQA